MSELPEKSARILIVEDDEDDFILTSDHLHQLDNHDFEIDWVINHRDALMHLEQNIHDICLMDYRLGAHNGIDVLKEAQKCGSVVPVIMLTGQANESLDQAALNAGAVDFLVKGDITHARFTRAIRYAIARQELQSARQENIDAETKNRSKDRFLAHLSHELRTPLTSILGYTELLLNGDKAPGAHKELSTILNNGKHLLSLLNDILDLSKISVGKLQLVSTPIELDSFIADVLALMQIPAAEKGLTLKFNAVNLIPKVIDADVTRLRQVLINLIFNAIKFTEDGEVCVYVEYDSANEPGRINFKVNDTGLGIAPDKIASIFQPFQQIEDMVSRKEQGAGLGLAICNELIRLMGGEINLSSKVGVGSEFTVTMPVAADRQNDLDELAIDISYVQDKVEFSQLNGSVLVVEDQEDIRNLVGQILTSFGLRVLFASDGQKGIDKIAEQASDIDAVIMDIHMPNMNGREAIVKIREAGFEAPVLALTAANMKGVEEELTSLGFTDVIGKPAQQIELHNHLKSVLSTSVNSMDEAQITGSSKQISKRKVLIVEDDEDSAELIKMLLASIDINADIAYSCEGCIRALNSEQDFSEIILDKNLPDGDGLNLTEEINRISPASRVVLVSGEEVEQDRLSQLGISQALMKPITLAKLSDLF